MALIFVQNIFSFLAAFEALFGLFWTQTVIFYQKIVGFARKNPLFFVSFLHFLS